MLFLFEEPRLVERLVDAVHPRHCVLLGRVGGQLELLSDVMRHSSQCFWR